MISRGDFLADDPRQIAQTILEADPEHECLILATAGPPCPDFSVINDSGQGRHGPEGSKFVAYCKLLDQLVALLPDHRIEAVTENVVMKEHGETSYFSRALQATPVLLDSADLGLVNRPRLWWTKIDWSQARTNPFSGQDPQAGSGSPTAGCLTAWSWWMHIAPRCDLAPTPNPLLHNTSSNTWRQTCPEADAWLHRPHRQTKMAIRQTPLCTLGIRRDLNAPWWPRQPSPPHCRGERTTPWIWEILHLCRWRVWAWQTQDAGKLLASQGDHIPVVHPSPTSLCSVRPIIGSPTEQTTEAIHTPVHADHGFALPCSSGTGTVASRARHRPTSSWCYTSLVLSTTGHPSYGLHSCPRAGAVADPGTLETTSTRSWSSAGRSYQGHRGTHWGHGRWNMPLVGITSTAHPEGVLGPGTPTTNPDPNLCTPAPLLRLPRHWYVSCWLDQRLWHHRSPTSRSGVEATYRPTILLPHWWEGIPLFEPSLHGQEAQTATSRPVLGDTPPRDTTWSPTG